MIKLIEASQAKQYPRLMDQMFSLRARVFRNRLGWKVLVENGKERDEFDDLNPLYALSLDDNENVVGTFRLLQTTGRTMLSEVFNDVLPDGLDIRSPIIWESTRFCVDTEMVKRRGAKNLNAVTGELLSSLLEIGLHAGLSHIVTVLDVRMERIVKRAGCPVERLGPPIDFCGVQTLAILMECSDEWIANIHRKNNISEPCVSQEAVERLEAA